MSAEESSRNEQDRPPAAVLRLRGLPWSCTPSTVQQFLAPAVQVSVDNVLLVRNLRGDAYVLMDGTEALEKGVTLHRQKIENRYVEVFKSTEDEYNEANDYVQHKMKCDRGYMCGLHLQDLPEDATEEEILHHFGAYRPAEDGVHILVDDKRKPTGEAIILYETEADTNLAFHKQKHTTIRGRLLKLSVCSRGEVYDTVNKDLSKFVKPGYIHTRNETYQGVLHLKDVPFKTSVQSIMEALPEGSAVHEAMVIVPSNLLVRRKHDPRIRRGPGNRPTEPADDAAASPTEDVFIVMDSEEQAAAFIQHTTSIQLGDATIQVSQTEMLELIRTIGCCSVFLRHDDAKAKNVLKLQQLPHSTQRQHLHELFDGFEFGEFGPMIITSRDGRVCIGAFVEFASEAEAAAAFEACKDKQLQGRNLLMEVAFKSALYVCQPLSERSRDHAQFRSGAMTCMRVKGIPYDSEDADVNEYFADLTVIGLLMCTQNGKSTGEAYVEFATLTEVLKGYARNRGALGSRYLDLCPVHKQEALNAANLMSGAEQRVQERIRHQQPEPTAPRRRRSPSPPRRSPEMAKRPHIEASYARRSDSRDRPGFRGPAPYPDQVPRGGGGFRGEPRPDLRSPPRDRAPMRRSRSRSRSRSRDAYRHQQPPRFDDRFNRGPHPPRRASPSPPRRGGYPDPYAQGRDSRLPPGSSRYPSPPRDFQQRDYRARGDSRSRDMEPARNQYRREAQHHRPSFDGRDAFDERDRFDGRGPAFERDQFASGPRYRDDRGGGPRYDRGDDRMRDDRPFPGSRGDPYRGNDRRFEDDRRPTDFRGDYRARGVRSPPRSPPSFQQDRYPQHDSRGPHGSADRVVRRDVSGPSGRDDRHMGRRDELLSGGLKADRGPRR